MQGRINIPTRGGGGDLSLNVFAQATEPSTKNGIWINTSASGSLPLIEKFDYNGIEITNSDFRDVSNGEKTYYLQPWIPYSFYCGAVVVIGTDIYLFGSYETNYQKYAYKYDTLTNSYARITNIPVMFTFGTAAAIGTEIFLIGGNQQRHGNFKIINVQFKNKYIYLFSVEDKYETKICNNVNIPVCYARICKDNTLQAYPAYYGDGIQWNRLPN